MMWKTIKDDELFVYWNGKLIYKKWLRTGASILLDKFGPPIRNKL